LSSDNQEQRAQEEKGDLQQQVYEQERRVRVEQERAQRAVQASIISDFLKFFYQMVTNLTRLLRKLH
jgi:hypothetical protein